MQIGNVFSAFDGLSGTQVALNQAGIKYGTYFASEVDKYAIQIAQKNYPKTVQLGDIRNIKGKDLGNIHLMVGGSPCTGFSFAGRRLNFDDPQSKLFFEFVRLLKEIKPRYFLLENVRMAKKHKQVITEHLGVEPIEINSSLLSAQSRNRLYWTNIPAVKQPEDLGIVLNDILESDATEPMYSNIYGGFKESKPRVHYNKSVTIRPAKGGGHIPSVTKKIYTRIEKQKVKVRKHEVDTDALVQMLRQHKRNSIKEIAEHCNVPLTQAEHWFRTDSSFSIPPAEIWDKLKEILNITTNEWDKIITEFVEKDGVYEMSERITQTHGKNPTLKASAPNKIEDKYYLSSKMVDYITADKYNNKGEINPKKARALTASYHKMQRANIATYVSENAAPLDKSNIRRLLPVECERLQTLPDNYTEGVSDTQRYRMIGNGFTTLIVSHILKQIENNPVPLKFNKQMNLL